jgi:hypothetical protein
LSKFHEYVQVVKLYVALPVKSLISVLKGKSLETCEFVLVQSILTIFHFHHSFITFNQLKLDQTNLNNEFHHNFQSTTKPLLAS